MRKLILVMIIGVVLISANTTYRLAELEGYYWSNNDEELMILSQFGEIGYEYNGNIYTLRIEGYDGNRLIVDGHTFTDSIQLSSGAYATVKFTFVNKTTCVISIDMISYKKTYKKEIL